jgi:hypothetical protein
VLPLFQITVGICLEKRALSIMTKREISKALLLRFDRSHEMKLENVADDIIPFMNHKDSKLSFFDKSHFDQLVSIGIYISTFAIMVIIATVISGDEIEQCVND